MYIHMVISMHTHFLQSHKICIYSVVALYSVLVQNADVNVVAVLKPLLGLYVCAAYCKHEKA